MRGATRDVDQRETLQTLGVVIGLAYTCTFMTFVIFGFETCFVTIFHLLNGDKKYLNNII